MVWSSNAKGMVPIASKNCSFAQTPFQHQETQIMILTLFAPIITVVNEQFKHHYTPKQELSVYESLIDTKSETTYSVLTQQTSSPVGYKTLGPVRV